MKKSTFNCVKDVLKDYSNIPSYIKQREEELRFPYHTSDINAGIKGTRSTHNKEDLILITIEQDRRLEQLRWQYKVVQKALEECGSDTRTIIEELYIRKYPRYTMQGLADNHFILCSSRTGKTLRTDFFEEIATQLYLPL